MLKNYIVIAVRNLMRRRLYAGIGVLEPQRCRVAPVPVLD